MATRQNTSLGGKGLMAQALLGLGGLIMPLLAQSEVTLYGTIDSGLGWTQVKGEEKESQRGGLSGGLEDSLWGISGQESLGDGVQALFRLEGGLDMMTGSSEEPDRLFNYQSWVGLHSDHWGELRLGRQYTAGQSLVSELEISSWKDFGMGALLRAADNYQASRLISWYSPEFAGLQLGLSYSADVGEDSAGAARPKLYSAALGYEQGPWKGALSYESLSRVHLSAGQSARAYAAQAGVAYEHERFRLAAAWSRQANGFVGRNADDGPAELEDFGLQGLGPEEFVLGGRMDSWYAGLAVNVGPGEWQLQWSQARPNWTWQDTGKKASRIHVLSTGYVYPLSPRTSLYAFAAEGRNYAMDEVARSDNPRTRRVAIGLNHQF